MEVDWNHSRCIACLGSDGVTVEHVIPESLGGILTCSFLCSHCSSSFGAGFESKARQAPEVRKAASGIGGGLSELKEKLERGTQYNSQFGDQTSKGKLRRDGQIGTSKLADGSLVVPEPDAPARIASMMQKTRRGRHGNNGCNRQVESRTGWTLRRSGFRHHHQEMARTPCDPSLHRARTKPACASKNRV